MTFSTTRASEGDADFVCVPSNRMRQIAADLECIVSANARLKLAMMTAGHDLRQHLHTLVGMLELATAKVSAADSTAWFDRAKTQVRRVIEELEHLAIQAEIQSQIHPPSKSAFAIDSVFRQVCCDWESEALARNLRFSVVPSDAVVESDPKLLGVILNNLVANAVRHTRSGGVGVDSFIRDQHLIVVVNDTGPGIPEAELQRTLNSLPRPDPAGAGLGLGLSIVRRTAELLEHEIEITTAPNAGTSVSLRVPLAGPPV